jgi:transcriptional regulator with XRE-family HTH domain
MKTRAPRPEPLTTDEPVPGDPRSEFGKKLRAARIRAGLTHAEVAEQAGLTQQDVSVVEGGRQNITLSTMIALARVTGHEVRVVLRRVRRQPD